MSSRSKRQRKSPRFAAQITQYDEGAKSTDQKDSSPSKPASKDNEFVEVNAQTESDETIAQPTASDKTIQKKEHQNTEEVIEKKENDSTFIDVPPMLCVPCAPPVQEVPKKRKLTDDEIFSKPNRHVYNGYCPCCD
jgi:hypothetical protein